MHAEEEDDDIWLFVLHVAQFTLMVETDCFSEKHDWSTEYILQSFFLCQVRTLVCVFLIDR